MTRIVISFQKLFSVSLTLLIFTFISFYSPMTYSSLKNGTIKTFATTGVLDKAPLPLVIGDSKSSSKKATLLLFMSASCPCSNSHLPLIKDLFKKYPDIDFKAIHSNQNEGEKLSKEYFGGAAIPFQVLQDTNGEVAKFFKATNTPSAYLISPKGEIIYSGALTNSATYEKSDSSYIGQAIDSYLSGKKLAISYRKPQGCHLLLKN